MSEIRVLNILGRDYSIRATAGEDDTLARAAQLLQAEVAQSKQRYPRASSQEMLVMTALNLCIPLLEQQQRLEAAEERLGDALQRVRGQLAAE